ncbi:MAG: hypothetical protein LUG66_07575 [Clostridiales bacterium]|nr:hypothetical protein [Clostridiales bacterium]
MKKAHKEALVLLTEAFNSSFNPNCPCGEPTESTSALLDVYPFIYANWLQSAAGFDHLITPYDFVCEASARLLPKGHFAYPYIKPNSYTSFSRFRPNIKEFTKDTHPVISDLGVYLMVFTADGSCAETEYGEVLIKSSHILKSKLSFYSPYYVEYLHNLAAELGLIKCLPSVSFKIYKAAVTPEDFFENPCSFEEVFDVSLNICRNKLNSMFPPESAPFTKDILLYFIKNYTESEEIMNFILSDFEIDVDAMIEDGDFKDDASIKTREDMIASSTHFLAVVLTKWFYNVFAYYLHIIRTATLYYPTFSFALQFFSENGKNLDYSQKAAVFLTLPDCSALTPFGSDFLNVKFPSKKYDGGYISKIPLSVIFKIVCSETEDDLDCPDFNEGLPKTFTFEIYNTDKPKDRQIFTFMEYDTLDNIYFAVHHRFKMRPISDFSIFTDESRSPFSEYTITSSDKPHKKADFTLINEVCENVGDRLWLRLEKKPYKNDKKPCYDYVAEVINIE